MKHKNICACTSGKNAYIGLYSPMIRLVRLLTRPARSMYRSHQGSNPLNNISGITLNKGYQLGVYFYLLSIIHVVILIILNNSLPRLQIGSWDLGNVFQDSK